MKTRLIMSGELHPCDGVKGCRYTVYQCSDSMLLVFLVSPKGEALDEASLKEDEIGQWLLNKANW